MVLFTALELAVFLQVPSVPDAVYDLAHELTEDAILGEVGARLTDPPQRGVKAVAISVAGRALTNPEGVRSETAGAISVTYRDGQSGVALTDGERRRLRRAVGLTYGAGSLDLAPADCAPRIDTRRVW